MILAAVVTMPTVTRFASINPIPPKMIANATPEKMSVVRKNWLDSLRACFYIELDLTKVETDGVRDPSKSLLA
jgi:hypothetical protein